MPVAPNRKNPFNQAAVIAVAGVLGAVAIFFLITRIADQAAQGDLQLQLGDDEFFVGDAENLALKFDDPEVFDGDPALFPGLENDRDIYLQHFGDNPLDGWIAFKARPDDAPRTCTLQWRSDSDDFVDPCDGEVFPADGEGLRQYATSVRNGQLVVTIVEQ